MPGSIRRWVVAAVPVLAVPLVAAALQRNMSTVPRCQSTFDLHGEILDAIEQRDAERAKRLSRTLIES